MPSTPTYCDISSYISKHHSEKTCPCNLSADKFMQHTVVLEDIGNEISQRSSIFLLLETVSQTSKLFLQVARNHFLLLAQRYHPDKNDPSIQDTCTKIMSALNKAYSDVQTKAETDITTNNKLQKTVGGKIFTYIGNELITCQHLDSFAIYGHPEYVKSWINTFTKEWEQSPTKLSKQKGVQYGDTKNSLYIIVYENGTILIQGIMAMHYSIENIDRLVKIVEKKQSLKPSARSNAFKEAVKHFKNKSFQHHQQRMQITQTQEITETTSTINQATNEPNESQTPLNQDKTLTGRVNSQPLTNSSELNLKQSLKTSSTNDAAGVSKGACNPTEKQQSDTEHSTEIQIVLQKALMKIVELENRLQTIQKNHEEHKVETEKRIEKLEKENGQLMRSLGPKISMILQQQQNEENSTKSTAQDNKPSTSDTNHIEQEEWTTVWGKKQRKQNHLLPQEKQTNTTNSKPPRIKFQWQKIVVIEKITDPTRFSSDDKVRREIGRNIDRVIIDRITRYSHNTEKISVQLATEEMRDHVINNWRPDTMFGSSTVRKASKNQNSNIGVAKGVPLDMTDEELNDDIQKIYPGISFQRMTKGQRQDPLRTVKLFFNKPEDLTTAIEEGLKLESQSQYVRVETLIWTPYVRHCSKCWRIGHQFSQCRSNTACPHCGKDSDEGAHLTCINDPVCRNCKGNHSANQRDKCQAYNERLTKLIQRQQELKDGY